MLATQYHPSFSKISLCSRIIGAGRKSKEYHIYIYIFFFPRAYLRFLITPSVSGREPFFPSVPPFSNYPVCVRERAAPRCCRAPRNREHPTSIVPRYVVSVLLSGPMYTRSAALPRHDDGKFRLLSIPLRYRWLSN